MLALMPFHLRDRFPASAPLLKQSDAFSDKPLKRVGSEANLAVASSRSEENQSAADFNVGWLFREVAMLVHVRISCAESEHEDNVLTHIKRKFTIALTSPVSVPFLPSAPRLRWAA